MLVGNFKSLAAGSGCHFVDLVPVRHARSLAPGRCLRVPVLGVGLTPRGIDRDIRVVRPRAYVGVHVLHNLPAHRVRPRRVEPRAARRPVFTAGLGADRVERQCLAAVRTWAWGACTRVVVFPVEVYFLVY